MKDESPTLPGQTIQAFAAGAIRAVLGANEGDPIGTVEEASPGDVYQLRPDARSKRLCLIRERQPGAWQTIAEGSAIGRPGERIFPVGLHTLMAPDGQRLGLVTAWHEASDRIIAIPLSPMRAGVDHTLVTSCKDLGDIRLSDVICVSFSAGTEITLPGGRPRVIEDLQVGDMVLTRDNGPQPIRWIGKASMRAEGAFAPIVISAGTLGNSGELVVSPHHRIFLYQRGQRRLAGAAEVLVQAKHLVDGERVWRREGGFVDYYSMAFDQHEIIYAEGIPAESLLVTEETKRLLPAEMAEDLMARFPGLRHSHHFSDEASGAAVKAEGPSNLFRQRQRH